MSTNEVKSTRNRKWESKDGITSYAVNEGEVSIVPVVEMDMETLQGRRYTVTLQGVNAQRIGAAALLRRVMEAHPVPEHIRVNVDSTRDIVVESAARYHVTDSIMREYGTQEEPDAPSIKYSAYVARDAFAVIVDGNVQTFDYMCATARIPERELATYARKTANGYGMSAKAYVATPLDRPERVTWYLTYEQAKEHALTDEELEELRNGGAVRRDK